LQIGATAAVKVSGAGAVIKPNVFDLFNATSRPVTASTSDGSQSVAADRQVRSSLSASRHSGFTALNDPFITTRSSIDDSSLPVIQSSSAVGRLPPIDSHAAGIPSESGKKRTRKNKSKQGSGVFNAMDASSAASDSQLIDGRSLDDTGDPPVVGGQRKSGSATNDSAGGPVSARPSTPGDSHDPLFVYSNDGRVHGRGGQSVLQGNQHPGIEKGAVDAPNESRDRSAKERRKKSKRRSNSQFVNDADNLQPEPRVFSSSRDTSGIEDVSQEPASGSGQSDPRKSSENPAGSNSLVDLFLAKKIS
jgi:hypothetical protein